MDFRSVARFLSTRQTYPIKCLRSTGTHDPAFSFPYFQPRDEEACSIEEEVSNDARQLLQSKSLSLSQNSSHIDWIISMYRVDGIVGSCEQGRLKSFSRGKTGSCGGVASSRGVGGIVEGSKFLSSRCQLGCRGWGGNITMGRRSRQ